MLRVLQGALIALGAGAASGQIFPNKTIRIVTTQPGGPNDFAARLIAQGLTGSTGQQVIVDNRGGGIIATDVAAKSPADGYTLLFNGSIVWLLPLMQETTPWDMFRNFSPVALAVRAPSVLVVHPSLPARSVRELVALAKARPGELYYASAVAGSANHLTAELFRAMAGVKIVHVPYKGGGQALTALIGGEAQMMFGLADAVMVHVGSGKLRALGVTSAEPSALFPGLPAIAATVPGYESVSMFGLLAPMGTPAPVVSRLSQDVLGLLGRAETRERFLKAGMEVVGGSPEQFAHAIKSEVTAMGKVIRNADIHAQ